MSSYCPICDRFVDNLDNCELPYDGNPSPSYDDSEEKVFINVDNEIWEVDKSYSGGLFRRNAMTDYEIIHNWLIAAKEVGTENILFYLVKVIGPVSWLQVSKKFAENQFLLM